MKIEEKVKLLNSFQATCFKAFRSIGFTGDNATTIFGIIIEMRNVILAAEKEDTILLHKHMGLCAEMLANYATINSIVLEEAVAHFTHRKMTDLTTDLDLEYYLEKIKDDMTFVKDMSEDSKTEFIQKCWVCIFPEDYCDDFLKIDRILKVVMNNNKIKLNK